MIQPPLSAYHIEAISYKNRVTIKTQEVENCLMHLYRIDQRAATTILQYMAPLLEDTSKHAILDDFMHKSRNLGIWFCACRGYPGLEADDGALVAEKWHNILYDSAQIRVLWGQSAPGDVEPAHRHAWRSVMLVVQGSTFKIEGADGSTVVSEFPQGAYQSHGETQSYSYTNLGSTTFQSLRFEVKI